MALTESRRVSRMFPCPGGRAGAPGGESQHSRRTFLTSAAAIGIAALASPEARQAVAQTGDATPVMGAADPPSGATPVAGEPESSNTTDTATSQPRLGGSIRLVRPGDTLGNFNPAAFAQDPQIQLSYLEPLLRPNPDTLRPEPCLARRWEWHENGRTLAFSVRDGVVWHDGTPFTAADAVFSFEVYRQDAESAVAGLFDLVTALEFVSDHELVVTFSERDPNFLFNAATLPIFSRGQYESFWQSPPEADRTLSRFDWSSSPPLGTGPWRVVSWDDRQVDFARAERYWGQGPWLETLEVAVEKGPRRRLEAWEAGESQIAWPVRPHDLERAKDIPGSLFPAPAASVMFAAFNFANPDQPSGSLWTDLRVREAASMAIDRERLAEEVFAGYVRWDAAGTVAQPWAHDNALANPPYNPEAAAILLDQAGWIDYDGDGVREDITGWQLRPVAIVRQDSRPELVAAMARVARDLSAVGMALTVEVLPGDRFEERWISLRNYDLIAYAYDQLPGFTDFDLYGSAWDIRTNPAGWNPGGYANPDADAAVNDFLTALSIERQAGALRSLQQVVNEDLFGLWLGFPDDLVLVAAGVEGFQPDMAWQTARTWNLWRSSS